MPDVRLPSSADLLDAVTLSNDIRGRVSNLHLDSSDDLRLVTDAATATSQVS